MINILDNVIKPMGAFDRHTIFGNNFLEYNILDVFGVQIEFSRIFDKFTKIPLIEVVVGGRMATVVVDNDG